MYKNPFSFFSFFFRKTNVMISMTECRQKSMQYYSIIKALFENDRERDKIVFLYIFISGVELETCSLQK